MSPNRKPLRRVALKATHQPRGNVNLFVEGKQVAKPASLEIVKPTVGDACHMVYIDATQQELTESWHPTVEAALYHARWEYGIQFEEWEVLNDG